MAAILNQLETLISNYINALLDLFNSLDVFLQAGALALAAVLMLFGLVGFIKFIFKFVKFAVVLGIIVGGVYFALKMLELV